MAKKMTVTNTLELMPIGEQKDFPAELSLTVKSMASMLGFKWNRVFKTRIDRERRVITVTRVS